MNIFLIQRIVKRCNDPANPNYLKVENVSTKVVGNYVASVVPRKGEIIFIDSAEIYDVVQVIYQPHGLGYPDKAALSVHIEVKPHKALHTYQATNYSFEETWPPVISLPVDLDYFKKFGEIDDDDEYDDDDPYDI